MGIDVSSHQKPASKTDLEDSTPNPKLIDVNKQYPLVAQTWSQMFSVKKSEVTVIRLLGNDDMGPTKKVTNSKKNLSYWIPVKSELEFKINKGKVFNWVFLTGTYILYIFSIGWK